MKKLRHEDYQVCWICPLDVERTAAEAMLDERHESLPNGPQDTNVYTLGRVGKHNIAIAGLPVGNSVSTANAANHMKYAFRSMRVVLLVGIGGAAPSKSKDIRLGDIVISYPDGIYGVVVQVDSGKSVPTSVDEDGFLLSGTLNRPPDQLLNVVRALQSKHRGLLRSEEPDFMAFLRKSIEERPRLEAEYPGVEEDRLFEPMYDHAGSESTCENCDSNRVVSRKARYSTEPRIHTGLIASANNVRKDGRTREKLSQKLNILCFEMEAAGIMNNFPCLVIRGISDYADSHKNNQWQPYAALVAAAYAKEWLLTFPEVELSRLDTVTGTDQEAQRQAAFLVPFAKDQDFVGREVLLAQIEELLEHDSRVALVGLGGVGKSQIAIEYAHRLHARTPGVSIFWLHASNITTFKASYASIATELRLPRYNDPEADQLQLVRQWLASESSGSWLLIIDNIDDVRLVKRHWSGNEAAHDDFHLLHWLPQRAKSAVLITSRDRHAAFCLVNHKDRIVNVDVMSSMESIELLDRKLTGNKENSAEKDLLTKTLEYIPLAMTQAAAYIARRQRMTISRYLSLLDSNQNHLLLLAEDNNDLRRHDNTPNSVLRTWHISFNQIQETSPSAAELLSRMCIYDKQHIPEFLLRAGIDEQFFDLEDALEVLLGYSFIHEEANKNFFDMHRLVQLATREWLRLDGRLEQENEAAVHTLAAVYPSGDYETWKACQMLEPHAQAVRNIRSRSSGARLSQAKLLYNRVWYFYLQAEYVKAGEMAWESLEERQSLLKRDQTDVLASVDMLALVLQGQGKYSEAEEMNRRALIGYETVLGLEHPQTLTSINNLAGVLQEQGRYAEAEEMNRKALAGNEKVLGSKHPDSLTSASNLARILQEQGAYSEAEVMARRALAGREEVLGVDHPDTLSSVSNLAGVLRDLDQYGEAEELTRRALAGREKMLGFDHPDTSTSYNNLAVVLQEQGKYIEAEEMARQALAGSSSTALGSEHPDTLTSVSNLADVLRARGKYSEAEELNSGTLPMYEMEFEHEVHLGKTIMR